VAATDRNSAPNRARRAERIGASAERLVRTAGSMSVGTVNIGSGSTFTVPTASNHSSRTVIVFGDGPYFQHSYQFFNGTFNLNNSDGVVPVTSRPSTPTDTTTSIGTLANATSAVAQGYDYGNWDGPGGIISTSSASDISHLSALGVIQNNQSGTAIYTAANPFDTMTP
jgi:hypothetical protein